jgi:hypothetical protein
MASGMSMLYACTCFAVSTALIHLRGMTSKRSAYLMVYCGSLVRNIYIYISRCVYICVCVHCIRE